jgi:CheY-like chemotaxis protein
MKKLKKILLIDDDPINNYVNQQLLENLQIAEQVSIEINGKNGLQHLLHHGNSTDGVCPELVIFDHFMPIMDGLEMMKQLQSSGFIETHKIVYILLAILSTKEHIEQFKALGVQEFTDKPLSQQVIMDAYDKYFADDTAPNHTSRE